MVVDRKLAPSFGLFELTKTEQRDLVRQNRSAAVVDPWTLAALAALATSVLQPIRDHFGRPLIVNSGFRFPTLNARVGGADDSDHKRGAAADCYVVGVPLEEVWAWLRTRPVRVGQVILENPDGGEPDWLHVALPLPWGKKDSAEFWTFDGSRYERIE